MAGGAPGGKMGRATIAIDGKRVKVNAENAGKAKAALIAAAKRALGEK